MKYDYARLAPEQLRRFTCDQRQIAGIRRFLMDDGRARGNRCFEVDNGAGLRFSVYPDRGMDIGPASYKGVPLSFQAPAGDTLSAFYQPAGAGWLRTWGGGLLTGCGLTNVGAPDDFDGEEVGLHGLLSHLPAENCSVSEDFEDGTLRLCVCGTMRQASMFGENLHLHRRISTAMGESSIKIQDRIYNRGPRPSRLMILYHINLGYPLLSPKAYLEAPEHSVEARDETAAAGMDQWAQCAEPQPGWTEQCFYHDIPADETGFSRIALCNPELGLRLETACRKDELPWITQWKQMGESEYVLGLEPGNCHVEGASSERERGTLKIIQPGESVNTEVHINLSENEYG